MNEQGRKRHSRKEWAALIQRQASSGLAQRDFCHREGLAVSTFTYWKRKLATRDSKSSPEPETPLFTPIQTLPECDEPQQAAGEANSSGWTLDLDLGDGLRLTLRKVA